MRWLHNEARLQGSIRSAMHYPAGETRMSHTGNPAGLARWEERAEPSPLALPSRGWTRVHPGCTLRGPCRAGGCGTLEVILRLSEHRGLGPCSPLPAPGWLGRESVSCSVAGEAETGNEGDRGVEGRDDEASEARPAQFGKKMRMGNWRRVCRTRTGEEKVNRDLLPTASGHDRARGRSSATSLPRVPSPTTLLANGPGPAYQGRRPRAQLACSRALPWRCPRLWLLGN